MKLQAQIDAAIQNLQLLAGQVSRLVGVVEKLEREVRQMGIVIDQHELDIQKIRRGEP